jgi:hypothetical protein
MPKMRMFKFWNEAGDEKEKEEIITEAKRVAAKTKRL